MFQSRCQNVRVLLAGVALIAGACIAGWPPGKLQALAGAIGIAFCLWSRPRIRSGIKVQLEESRHRSPAVRDAIARQPLKLLFVVAWFAGLVALGEIAYLAYSKEITRYAAPGAAYLWRVPMGYGLLFAVVGTALYVVAKILAGPRAFILAMVVCAFIAATSWIQIVVKGLEYWTLGLLALGIAVQIGRLAGGHPYLTLQLMRRTLPVLAALVVVPGVVVGTWRVWKESSIERNLPAPPGPSPNVLLIVADTARAESMGVYGYKRPTTPNLDRLAATGTVFDFAMSTSPWTLPSHGSMFTGRQAGELSTGFETGLNDDFPTLAEGLTESGYLTGGFAANHWYVNRGYGLSRGFTHWEDEPTTPERALVSTSFVVSLIKAFGLRAELLDNVDRLTAADINAELLDWLSSLRQDRPFFAFLNYYDAHGPYEPATDYWSRFRQTKPEGRVASKPYDAWNADEIRELNDAYDGAMAYVDDQIAALLRELGARGVLENTLVIVTSDHGEQFGDHNLMEHSNSLYTQLLHVPLIMIHPQLVPAGARIRPVVSLSALPATVLDLLKLPNSKGFPGASMARMFNGSSSPSDTGDLVAEVERVSAAYPDSYPARIGAMRSLFSGTHHYIRNLGNGREELYDFVRDMREIDDLSSKQPADLAKYRDQLTAILAARKSAAGHRDWP